MEKYYQEQLLLQEIGVQMDAEQAEYEAFEDENRLYDEYGELLDNR